MPELIKNADFIDDYQKMNNSIKFAGQAGTICGATFALVSDVVKNGQVAPNSNMQAVYSHCGTL